MIGLVLISGEMIEGESSFKEITTWEASCISGLYVFQAQVRLARDGSKAGNPIIPSFLNRISAPIGETLSFQLKHSGDPARHHRKGLASQRFLFLVYIEISLR